MDAVSMVRRPILRCGRVQWPMRSARRTFDKAMSLRDPEFREALESFFTTSHLQLEGLLLPKYMRVR